MPCLAKTRATLRTCWPGAAGGASSGARAARGHLPGEEVWLVGDTAVDMECATNSGCVPVLLGAAARDEFLRFLPRLSFADEASLFRSLRAL